MNKFKKGDRVIAQALMKEHPLYLCGNFKGIVVDDLPEIENIECGIPYHVHIDGTSEEITYPFLAAEMKKISSEEEKEDRMEKHLAKLGDIEEAAVLGMKRRYCRKYTECACLGCPMEVDTDEKLDCALLIVLAALKEEREAKA